jgi:4'-phosphopantetheinyl transferase
MSEGWTEPQSWPALATDEVHVWLAHLPSAHTELEQLTALLTPEEQERARQFRTGALRERWVLARAILRSLLARYAEVSAQEIIFQLGAHGKPALMDGSGLHFNTSHSGDHAAFAFTRAGDIGVDIEHMRGDMRRHEAIAQRFFTPGERAELAAVPEPERVRAFFDLWTRKEAFVKARGDGVFSGLENFAVSLREPRVLNIAGGDAAHWWMGALPEMENCAGAVIVKGLPCQARFWKWNAALTRDWKVSQPAGWKAGAT